MFHVFLFKSTDVHNRPNDFGSTKQSTERMVKKAAIKVTKEVACSLSTIPKRLLGTKCIAEIEAIAASPNRSGQCCLNRGANLALQK